MKDQYQVEEIILLKKERLTSLSHLFTFQFKNPERKLSFKPGQFIELSIAGLGEIPISVASDASKARRTFELAIQEVGVLTRFLAKSKEGRTFGFRGPYGVGWPVEKLKNRNVIIIAGGCGLAPFRALISHLVNNQKDFKTVQLLYGARDSQNMFFKKDYKNWQEKVEIHFALDKIDKKVGGCLTLDEGLVTNLLEQDYVKRDALALVCGPPIMSKFVTAKLIELGYHEKEIFVTLERRMECAIGICQHCAVGPYYVCKDGPVFPYDKLKDIPGIVEIST